MFMFANQRQTCAFVRVWAMTQNIVCYVFKISNLSSKIFNTTTLACYRFIYTVCLQCMACSKSVLNEMSWNGVKMLLPHLLQTYSHIFKFSWEASSQEQSEFPHKHAAAWLKIVAFICFVLFFNQGCRSLLPAGGAPSNMTFLSQRYIFNASEAEVPVGSTS